MTRFGIAVGRVDERMPGVDLPLLSVSQSRGVIRRTELTDKPARADSLDVYKVCRQNDIVFNKMSIRAGALGVAAEDGLVTYHYEVMRPRTGFDARYLAYLMKSEYFTSELIKRERGIGAGDQVGIRTTEVPFRVLRTIDAAIPSHEVQGAIADFLDRETAKIGALIEKQRAMIARLTERKSSLIEAILDDCRDRVRLVSVITLSQTGPFGTQLSADEYEDGGVPVINPTHIRRGQIEPEYGVSVSMEKAAELERHQFQENDIALGRKGDVDKSAIIAPEQEGWICGSDAMLLRPDPARIDPFYLWWFFQSRGCHVQLDLWSVGSTVSGLNQRVIRRVTLPLPSLAQQVSIVRTLDAKVDSIDAMLRRTENFVLLAQERRAALITAAVTGNLDIATGKVT